MTADCYDGDCRQDLPRSHVISTTFTRPRTSFYTDCARNEVFFIDTPGLEDITDAGSGAFLNNTTTAGRVFTASSLSAVAEHWDCTSPAYMWLEKFFSQPAGAGTRPARINIVYRDPAETWVDAATDFSTCYKCWRFFSVVPTDSTGADISGSTDMLDLKVWAQANNKVSVIGTTDATARDNLTELTSIPAQSTTANLKYQASEWMNGYRRQKLNDDCEKLYFEDDGAGNPTAVETTEATAHPVYECLPEWNPLQLASFLASYSTTGTGYNFNAKVLSAGCSINTATSGLGPDTVVTLNGFFEAERMVDATHHINVYDRIDGQYCGHFEGVSDTGLRLYDVAQELYVKELMEQDIITTWWNGIGNNQAIGNTTANIKSILAPIVARNAQRLVSQGVIRRVGSAEQIEAIAGVENKLASGSAWWLTLSEEADLTESQVINGVTPVLTFCYYGNNPINFVRLSLCEAAQPAPVV